MDMLRFDYFKLLDLLMIGSHIKAYVRLISVSNKSQKSAHLTCGYLECNIDNGRLLTFRPIQDIPAHVGRALGKVSGYCEHFSYCWYNVTHCRNDCINVQLPAC